jgi:hypothetical protein
MNFLSPEEILTLKTELAKPVYASMSDQERSDYIHRPEGTMDNPEPQGQVPLVMTVAGLLGLLTDPSNHSLAKLAACPSAPALRNDILAQEIGKVKLWAAFFAGAGIITSGEYAAVSTYLNSTIPDPSYSATIPAPSPVFRLFGGKTWSLAGPNANHYDRITIEDIALARS